MAHINRRSFLKSSVLGASGALGVAAAGLPPHAASAETPAAKPAGQETYRLTREIPVEGGFDLIVAGGGPAGTAAAVCAARLGAKVLLLEATGCLGGMGSSGLVTGFCPSSDGNRMLACGLMREIVSIMQRRGFLGPQVTPDFYERRFGCWTPFQAEGYKIVLDELATTAGVEVRYFTRVVEADAIRGTVRGVIAHNIEGFRCLRGRTFIDGSGDAVLAALCGAKCREAGRDTPHIMPPSLCALVAGIDWERASKPDWNNPRDEQKLLEKAIADGFFSEPDRHFPGMVRVGHSTGMLNAAHVFHTNALRSRSLSEAMVKGRRRVQEYVAFYRKYVPGCEQIEEVTTGNLMGVRESRRIVGEYELVFADFIARRQFPDQIGVYNFPVDIHPYDNSNAEYQRFYNDYNKTGHLNRGECYGIPYGILVPKGWRNLWVAGRCNSSDVRVHASVRAQPAASMMGQAAGTAAVQSIATGQPACELDTEKLVLCHS